MINVEKRIRMLKFKRLTLDDIPTVKPYFAMSGTRTCDNTVGGAVMWRDYFETEYAIFNDTIVFKVMGTSFTMPIGGDVDGMLMQIEIYCRENDMPMVINPVGEADMLRLKSRYKIVATANRDMADYLYLAEDLAYMRGRKYSGPRNHINRFKRENKDYCYKKITADNIGDVISFYEELVEASGEKDSDMFLEDREKTFEVLNNFEKYSQIGLALYVEDKVVAFGIGEVISDTLFEHIEKADTTYAGAYQMIASGFAREHLDLGITYVNREDDAGDEGLRKSKLSYRPIELLDKYKVKVIV